MSTLRTWGTAGWGPLGPGFVVPKIPHPQLGEGSDAGGSRPAHRASFHGWGRVVKGRVLGRVGRPRQERC